MDELFEPWLYLITNELFKVIPGEAGFRTDFFKI